MSEYGIFLTILFIMCDLYFKTCYCFVEVKFLAGSLPCHDETSVQNGCVEHKNGDSIVNVGQNPVLSCLTQCQHNRLCVGASVDVQDKNYCVLYYECFYQQQQQQLSTCNDDDSTALDGDDDDRIRTELASRRRYYSKHCAHNGTWAPSERACQCVDGWVGNHCQDLPTHPNDLGNSGYQMGLHRIYLDLRPSGQGVVIPVDAFISPPSYSMINVMHQEGSLNFNRTWKDYRRGFFQDSRNMWVGLDALHSLTQAGYRDLVLVYHFQPAGNVYVNYHGFSLSGEADGFKFSFERKTTGGDNDRGYTFGDCLGPYINVSFSTYDHNNNNIVNCPASVGSGWWFKPQSTFGSVFEPCYLECHMFGKGPEHWTKTGPNQRLTVPGIPITIEDFKGVQMYITEAV